MSYFAIRARSAVEARRSVVISFVSLILLLGAAGPAPAPQGFPRSISIDVPREQKHSCVAHRDYAVLKLAFSRDGKKLASVGSEWMKVWDPSSLLPVDGVTFGRDNYPVDVGFVPQGVAVLVTTVRRFDT